MSEATDPPTVPQPLPIKQMSLHRKLLSFFYAQWLSEEAKNLEVVCSNPSAKYCNITYKNCLSKSLYPLSTKKCFITGAEKPSGLIP